MKSTCKVQVQTRTKHMNDGYIPISKGFINWYPVNDPFSVSSTTNKYWKLLKISKANRSSKDNSFKRLCLIYVTSFRHSKESNLYNIHHMIIENQLIIVKPQMKYLSSNIRNINS